MSNLPAIIAEVEDPTGAQPVDKAFCCLSEIHANMRTGNVVAIFECWRNQESYDIEKQPFTMIQVKLPPDEGGRDLCGQATEQKAMPLDAVIELCLEKCPDFVGGYLRFQERQNDDGQN